MQLFSLGFASNGKHALKTPSVIYSTFCSLNFKAFLGSLSGLWVPFFFYPVNNACFYSPQGYPSDPILVLAYNFFLL